ncbi:MAG: hypothetical protein JW814_10910 [Candidatus Krumholzibacteriota bacterium]|nr:hypothetical protein [Candidatus Krumholzibacteriota bacterium]
MESENTAISEDRINRCWEFLSCGREDCPAHGKTGIPCWEVTGHRCRDKVFGRIEEKLIQCCFKCDFFIQLKERMKGRRWADITLLETLEDALIRSSKYSSKVEELYMEVIRRSKLMNLLSEVSKIIAHLDKEEDIILAILTVITAREGLGFNRAFIFLRGNEYDLLRGKYALGPSTPEEAVNIWKILDKDTKGSIEKLVAKGKKLHYLKNSLLTKLTSGLSIPTEGDSGIIFRGLDEIRFVKREDLTTENDLVIADSLGLEDFCVCPIATAKDRLGLVIVDNKFTGKEVTPEDAHLLEMIVSHATSSLKAAQLKESLRTNVESLKSAYRKLKANEERMMKAERLAISGEMTSSVIHEIKNPLVSIGGFTRNLLKTGDFNEKDREKLEIILNETIRLETYLESLSSSVSELNIEDSNINQILEDNCNLLENEFEEKKVRLFKSFDPNLPYAPVDHVKIHEVFLNIFQNSLEAVDMEGSIWVRTIYSTESKSVIIEISDDGSGIGQDQMTRIFTPFFTTKEKGSGLGLAFAQRIIKDHGGNIAVSSVKGRKTSFIITLPSVHCRFIEIHESAIDKSS